MSDDDSVLGNLPRSRPGRRSGKREAARNGSKPRTPAAKRKPAATSARRHRRRRGGSRGRSADPVGEALRTAAKVAETGIRLTSGVAQEIVRRLPRP